VDALLSVEEIDAYYDRSHVLQGVSLQVMPGEVVALLGRNGAGKSTTLKSIMGIVVPHRGQVRFAGAALAGLAPYRIARHGIAYVPEDRGIFASLTVEENLTLAVRRHRSPGRWSLAAIHELFPRLAERGANMGGKLSGGEQQMLAIARALMLDPALLVLDEPTEGLAPVVVQEIASVAERLKREGVTMLLVEQNYPFATRLADRVYVLGKGRIRWQGTPHELEADESLKRTWIGV
jgi:branched-chain amino acid transport system ATP-binding protein